VTLEAGREHDLGLDWFQAAVAPHPLFGMQDDTPALDAGVSAARRATVAIVLASYFSDQGFNRRPSCPPTRTR
jgi:hypothetical protein